ELVELRDTTDHAQARQYFASRAVGDIRRYDAHDDTRRMECRSAAHAVDGNAIDEVCLFLSKPRAYSSTEKAQRRGGHCRKPEPAEIISHAIELLRRSKH